MNSDNSVQNKIILRKSFMSTIKIFFRDFLGASILIFLVLINKYIQIQGKKKTLKHFLVLKGLKHQRDFGKKDGFLGSLECLKGRLRGKSKRERCLLDSVETMLEVLSGC